MRRKRPYSKDLRLGRAKLLAQCVESLEADGYKVYKRGFPTLAAEKNCEMRFFVVNPLVTFHPVILGSNKDSLSEAFYRCFGVKFEVWENQEPEEAPKSWI